MPNSCIILKIIPNKQKYKCKIGSSFKKFKNTLSQKLDPGSNEIVCKNKIKCFIRVLFECSIRVSRSGDCSIRVYRAYFHEIFDNSFKMLMISSIMLKIILA